MKRFSFSMALAVLSLAAATSAHAQNINPVLAGWFENTGRSANSQASNNQNYAAGLANGVELRNFFVFDLTNISGPITSATLLLYNPIAPPDFGNGYEGDATETYDLTSTTTSPTDIQNVYPAGTAGQAIYSTLGTGTSYATIVASSASNGQTLSLSFNTAGLSALNSGIGGLVAFGGRITTIGGSEPLQYLFSATDPNGGNGLPDTAPIVLSLTTAASAPEPGTLALLTLGGMLIIARRKHK